MSRTKVGVLVGVLGFAAVALWLWSRERGSDRASTTAATPAVAKPMSADPAPAPTPEPPRPRVRRVDDAAAVAALRERIRIAKQRRATSTAPSTTSTAPAPELPPTELDRSYIQSAVRELIPLIAECYEEGLVRVPTLAGTLVVDFTIEGEADVGGVIGESTIVAADSTLVDAQVRECIQETMFALEIDAPSGGGVTRVTYPFEFRPGPE